MGKAFITILHDSYNFPKPEEAVIKAVVKEWLETVSLPYFGRPQAIAQILSALVDEPE